MQSCAVPSNSCRSERSQRRLTGSGLTKETIAETCPTPAIPPIRRYLPRAGKSPFARKCVVGLRGLELRARHAVLSNQSLSLPQCCKRGRKSSPYAANPNQHRCRCIVGLDPAIKRRRTAQRHCREMTGNPLRLERYCRQFPGAKGASRSCPAGSIAVAGLRWCGAAANRTEDLNVQICKEANEQEGPEAA